MYLTVGHTFILTAGRTCGRVSGILVLPTTCVLLGL